MTPQQEWRDLLLLIRVVAAWLIFTIIVMLLIPLA